MYSWGLLLLAFSQTVAAWGAPGYGGYRLVWQDDFAGGAGELPNGDNWNMITNLRVNNELQDYTTSNRNLQRSGGSTLQIVPWNENGRWTSGRVESKYEFTPEAGRLTMAEARIRFGDNPIANKKGYWPAFWLLGASIRRGTDWPRCGEIDILETVNGQLRGLATVHCDVYPGGICNEPTGRGASTGFPDQGWHNWRVVWDRRNGDWTQQTITWYLNEQQFHQVAGWSIGSEGIWQTLAHSPMYFILNMAVGGDLPGAPDGNTWDGYGSMMEVAYVAHYVQS
ncbi:Beta-glucanase [Scedosporium apiospermum]|uniref:Beta-glucanase n=1 Tax=Pseudallescheria apiosperma TaxID=563466 RepID=A0A084FUV1_PSEDA|nr:Beta-glucanase [Scedosporium apiospermum]KEZ38863.1 Beta-glucanase [Scedosporium apiospermum]